MPNKAIRRIDSGISRESSSASKDPPQDGEESKRIKTEEPLDSILDIIARVDKVTRPRYLTSASLPRANPIRALLPMSIAIKHTCMVTASTISVIEQKNSEKNNVIDREPLELHLERKITSTKAIKGRKQQFSYMFTSTSLLESKKLPDINYLMACLFEGMPI